jgi:bla regulator protein BlaR1
MAQTTATPDWQTSAGGHMAFEVASVRLNPGPVEPSNFRLSPDDAYTNTGGILNADESLANYIFFAYKIWPSREQYQAMLAHLPKWANTDNYEIHARAAEENPTKDQMRLMMQSLLKQRFGLAVHYETQDTLVLEMSLARPATLGPNLHPHEAGPACQVTGTPAATAAAGAEMKDKEIFPEKCGAVEAVPTPNQMILMGGRDTTLEMIAKSFSIARLGRPIVDETGLTGTYDFTLNWSPDPGTFRTGPTPQDTPAPDPQGPTFLEAVNDQLGLKLKPGKAPLTVLMIDHVDRPSEN